MKTPAPADLQRWSDDVARDAASLSFLPLARAYRRQGRRDAALRICMRGLARNPDNVEAHGLLAVLFFESGQRVKAYDEWSMVLTLEADNFDALRGMGFYYLEHEDYVAAMRHLERASAQKPSDPAVQEGLRIIRERIGDARPAPSMPFELVDEPWATTPVTESSESRSWSPARVAHEPPSFAALSIPHPAPTPAPAPQPAPTPAPSTRAAPATLPATAPAAAPADSDPERIFDPLLKGGQILGALVVDRHGLIMGGALTGGVGPQAEALGAILGGAIEEAVRTAAHLALGNWQGVLLEADTALLHFAPVRDDMIVLLAARRTAPTGWVLRSAAQAAAIADRFLEVLA